MSVTKIIIMGELPFSFVDNKGFRHFCSAVILQFIMASQRIIGRDRDVARNLIDLGHIKNIV